MTVDPLWSAALVILGALITLGANLAAEVTRRRMDSSTRWDSARLDAYSTFSTVVGSILRPASKAGAKERLPETSLVFERLVLLGSSEAVLAADRARVAASAYVSSLPNTDDEAVDADGDGIAYTSGGARRVILSKESTDLQLAGFAALNTLVQEARKQLGIKSLQADVMGRPL
jgi:hypothetical protein